MKLLASDVVLAAAAQLLERLIGIVGKGQGEATDTPALSVKM